MSIDVYMMQMEDEILNILEVSVRDDAPQRYSFDGMLAAACAAVHI